MLGFAVADLAEIMTELAARGVKWEFFPRFSHDSDSALTLPDGARVAWLRDPDGNLLSIVQYA